LRLLYFVTARAVGDAEMAKITRVSLICRIINAVLSK
jgi:hypothetical protein